MAGDTAAKVIITDLGHGAKGVTVFGEPSNRAGEVRDLKTRINAPASRRPKRQGIPPR
jgi:hypothetical protein